MEKLYHYDVIMTSYCRVTYWNQLGINVLSNKFYDNSVYTFVFIAPPSPPPPPQAQELRKSPGGIGLMLVYCTLLLDNITSNVTFYFTSLLIKLRFG